MHNKLIINKEDITKGLSLYNINDNLYISKCYECLENILSSESLIAKFNELYNTIFIAGLDRDEVKKLLLKKELDEIFGGTVHPFVTNLLLLSGYKLHLKNFKTFNLSNEEKEIYILRLHNCLLSNGTNSNIYGIRMSQVLWGAYIITMKIIEVGRLQYELCSYNPVNEQIKEKDIKIHIPAGSRLSISDVKKSIYDSKTAINRYFGIESANYYCNSWLLSNELQEIVDKNSNIHKFYNLFEIIKSDEDATSDILNFVFGSRDITDYSLLEEKTSLQKKLKEMLLANKKINIGLGKLKL